MPNASELRIAERIREAREYLELSVEEVADMLGVVAADVRAIEAAEVAVTAATLAEISRTLGRGLEFFTGTVSPAVADDRTAFLARAAETLSDRDIGELQRFAIYLRTRSEGAPA